MAKLTQTSETAMAITFLVMNLSTWLRRVFCAFCVNFSKLLIFEPDGLTEIISGSLYAYIKLSI